MRRNLRDFFSYKALRHIIYIPFIILKVKNWYPLLLNYLGFKDSADIYILRNGIKIKTAEGYDSSAIIGIFIKKVYGDVYDNSIVIDIGAHIGVYSLFASIKKNTMVYAYEPDFNNFKLLLENIKLNNLKNINAYNIGISGKREVLRLYTFNSSQHHSIYLNNNWKYAETEGEYLEIQCISLKDIFIENKIEKCEILKLDCEGAEFEILYNTSIEYLRKINKIRLEYHEHVKGYYINDLLEFLNTNGFRIVKFSKSPSGVWLESITCV